MIIYKATNNVNGKCYIGQTKTLLSKRIYQHIKSNNKCYFTNALKKYSLDNFKWTILEICFTQEELNEKEKMYIKIFNSNDSSKGYNLNSGGMGYIMKEEQKKKLSEINKGKIISTETKLKMSNSQIGHKVSEETRKKIGDSHRGINETDEVKRNMSERRKGYIMKEEQKKKISEALLGKKREPFSEEWKRNISKGSKGKKHIRKKKMSEEQKKKMSDDRKGQIPWNKGLIGIYSKDTLNKMSISQKKRFNKNG